MCKFSLFYALVYHSYGVECVIITCGHLINMQGCLGNCSVGCTMCMQSTIVYGTGIMQIQPKSGVLPEAFFSGC